MERLKRLAAKVAAFLRKRIWTIVKFGFLFAIVTWFASRNFGGLVVGFSLAILVTGLSVANWRIFDKASDAFFDVDEKDESEEKGKKASITIFKRILYTAGDYGLAALSIALVLAIKKLDFPYLFAVFAVWILIDIPSSAILVAIYEKTGRDMTLGRSYRRMANIIYSHSKISGIMVFIYEATLASFWSGPDYTVIFFREELKTRRVLVIALILITVAHSFLWAAVYWSGYDDVINFWFSLFK